MRGDFAKRKETLASVRVRYRPLISVRSSPFIRVVLVPIPLASTCLYRAHAIGLSARASSCSFLRTVLPPALVSSLFTPSTQFRRPDGFLPLCIKWPQCCSYPSLFSAFAFTIPWIVKSVRTQTVDNVTRQLHFCSNCSFYQKPNSIVTFSKFNPQVNT